MKSSSLFSPTDIRRTIIHLTTVHDRNDIRIYRKQIRSLVAHGYDVILVVADGKGDEVKEGVRIRDIYDKPGRLNRVLRATRRMFKEVIALDAELYHFHDPELIPVALKLKRLGRRVVFDSHEDVPKQLLAKPYLNPLFLRYISGVFSLFERHTCPHFDAIVTATPSIRDKFSKINPCCIDVNNYPILEEFENTTPWTDKQDEICYVGGITGIRGIREIVQACEMVHGAIKLNLAGRFSAPDFEAEIRSYSGWSCVNELGFLDRSGVRRVLEKSIAGMVTLHPVINYLEALPVKMFEYMAAGIPVIASDFPFWRKIIENNDCGLCVNPYDPAAIAKAIDFFLANPERAREMGENGRKAVHKQYNWMIEEEKLLNLYRNLLG